MHWKMVSNTIKACKSLVGSAFRWNLALSVCHSSCIPRWSHTAWALVQINCAFMWKPAVPCPISDMHCCYHLGNLSSNAHSRKVSVEAHCCSSGTTSPLHCSQLCWETSLCPTHHKDCWVHCTAVSQHIAIWMCCVQMHNAVCHITMCGSIMAKCSVRRYNTVNRSTQYLWKHRVLCVTAACAIWVCSVRKHKLQAGAWEPPGRSTNHLMAQDTNLFAEIMNKFISI